MASDLQGSTLAIKGRAYRPLMATYLADLWTAQNPILQRGEIGIEQNTYKFKVGNGVDRWNSLPYSSGPKGDDGTTFTPFVNSTTGVISWTNNGDLPNPDPVNITGPQGETGPTGPYFTPFVNATTGDISWTNNGGLENPTTVNIKGPQGETGLTGPTGPYFTPFVNSTTGDISWTNNGGLENPTTVNIKGPQGIQGIQGPQGPTGPQGLVITNIIVTDVTGVISVTTSASISVAPTAKALIGGATIAGTWTGSGTSWTFTPTEPSDVLIEAWIVTLPAA